MSLPDLLLKDSLFRVPPEGSHRQRQSLRSKMAGPLINPLLEGRGTDDTSKAHEDDLASGPHLPAESSSVASESKDATSVTQEAAICARKTCGDADSVREEAQGTTAAKTSVQDAERRLVIPDALRVRLESLYNASQLAALEDSLKVEGVTLIQGPPGTGKTSTIVGVVSVILHAQLEGQQLPQSSSASVRPRCRQPC